jgi:4-diphosphocytidyl-2-C-methyl-D-erythritol kinase
VLVNPGVPLATREVFARLRIKASAAPPADPPADAAALLDWLAGHGNDLTDAAIASAPAVSEVLGALGDVAGARLVRMSGSGPTCFALFSRRSEAEAAARALAARHASWWVQPVTLGGP